MLSDPLNSMESVLHCICSVPVSFFAHECKSFHHGFVINRQLEMGAKCITSITVDADFFYSDQDLCPEGCTGFIFGHLAVEGGEGGERGVG